MICIRSLISFSLVGLLCAMGTASAQSWAGSQSGYGVQPGYGYNQGYAPGYQQGYVQSRPALSALAAEMGYRDSQSYETDRQFARQAQAQALSYPRVMLAVRWSNPNTGNVGETVIAGEGQDAAGHLCRDIRETIRVNGRQVVNTGLACRINGIWRTVG